MIRKLPQIGETRVRCRFAWLPMEFGSDKTGYVRIWLRFFYVREEFTRLFVFEFPEWKVKNVSLTPFVEKPNLQAVK